MRNKWTNEEQMNSSRDHLLTLIIGHLIRMLNYKKEKEREMHHYDTLSKVLVMINQ